MYKEDPVIDLPVFKMRDRSKDECILSLNRREQLTRNKWILRHKDKCPDYVDYHYLVSYAPGLGVGATIICSHCHEEYDITDYGSW